MYYNDLNIHKHAQKLLYCTGRHRGFTSLFSICKTGLVSHIEYNENIQTLISKSEFSMRQHDLETHDSITTQSVSDTT